MASAFNLTAQINLRGPTNLKPIVSQIKRSLGSITSTVDLKIDTRAAKNIDDITSKLKVMNRVLAEAKTNARSLSQSFRDLSSSLSTVKSSTSSVSGGVTSTAQSVQKVAQNINVARTEMEEFGKQSALAIRRFAAFSVVTGAVFALTNAITSGFKAFVQFDRELVKLQQVTGQGAIGIKSLENEITRLATALGVSSESLMSVASTLAQAGLTADETRIALAALAKTELAPSFDNLTDTTEGAIAAMRQFGLEAGELEAALGSINAVAAAFAVESRDIIVAIQRTGGVFAAASKGVSEGKDALNEFIAVFTSVRATTRESAETIATGLRTIFTRIQRAGTIKQLREFGVELQDLEGKFVGGYEAIKRLSEALNKLDPRDVRFSTIVEELGGFRQIGKVIPLIQQFATTQQALGVAQRGQSSLTDAQIKAQQSLAIQLAKVREQFLALIRDIGQSTVFTSLFKIVLGLTSGFLSLAGAFKPILPILAVFTAIKGVSAIGQFATGFFGGLKKGGGAGGAGKNIGETISGAKDKERAAVTARAADAISQNTKALSSLTSAVSSLESTIRSKGGTTLSGGGKVLGFNKGGLVPGNGGGDTVPAYLEGGEIVINRQAVKKYGAGNLLKMNKHALGGKIDPPIKGSDIAKFYPSLQGIVNSDQKYSATIIPENITASSDDVISVMIRNKRKQKNLLGWQNFEVALAKAKGLTLAKSTSSYLDYPSQKAEAKFLPADGSYGEDEEDDLIKGNNNETMLAKLIGEKLYRENASNKVTTYYASNPKQIKGIVNSYALGENSSKTKYGAYKLKGGGLIQKFASAGKVLGARSKFRELSPEEIAKLSTKDLIAYGKALAQDIFTTGGAGMAVGHEFIEIPQDRIVPELEPDLVTYMGKRGFWREKVSPFGKAKEQVNQKTAAKADRQTALTAQVAKQADEVAARNQEWSKITSGSDIDKYLLSSLVDPILSDYKIVRGGGSLAKPFHYTRLRQTVNKALDSYDDFDYSPANIDKLVSGMAAKRFAAGGLIQNFVDGGIAELLSDQDIETRLGLLGGPQGLKTTIGTDRLNELIREKVRGESTAGMILKLPTLRAKLKSERGSEYRDFISAAIIETEQQKAGATANIQNLTNQALSNYAGVFGGAGMYQEGNFTTGKIILIPDSKKKRAVDKLKGPTSIEIIPATLAQDEIMKQARVNAAKARKADLNTQIGISTSQTAADIAQQYGAQAQLGRISEFNKQSAIEYVSAVADALDTKADGSRIFLDFDKTLAYGADTIGQIAGSDKIDLSAFSDINKVKKGLAGATLSGLSKKLISLSSDMDKKQPGLGMELLKRLFVVSARPSNTMSLIAQWLNSKGLNIPGSNVIGVGGTGLSESDIAVNKAREIIARGGLEQGSVFVDDDPANLKQARAQGIISKQYGATMTPEFEREATQEEGLKYQDIVRQTLASYDPALASAITINRQGQSLDFPNGLGPLAATWFDEPKLSNIPTDVKRTISQSKVIENIANYLRIAKGYAFGGKADGPSFEEVRQKIIDKYPSVDFRISKRKSGRGFGYNLLGALKEDGGLLKSKGLKFEQPGNLQKLIEASDKMASSLINPQGLATGGKTDSPFDEFKYGSMEGGLAGLITGLYGAPGSVARQFQGAGITQGFDPQKIGAAGPTGLQQSAQQPKKEKNFGKIGLRNTGSEITATYFKNDERSGFVSAKKASGNLYTIGLSKATKGYGPKLYDIVMEAATAAGGMLTSDRNQVSDAARAVWAYYFNNRGDVNKTPLDPSQWTKNSKYIDPKLYGKKETWPPATDPAWILQTGYSKSPSLINSPDVIDMNDPKYAKFIQMQQTSFMTASVLAGDMRRNGGLITSFANGGQSEGIYQSEYRKNIQKQIQALMDQIAEGKSRLEILKSHDVKPGMIGKLTGKGVSNPYQSEIFENEEFISRLERQAAQLKSSLEPQTFSKGGGVLAKVSNGEAFVPPNIAKKIGYSKLDKMNQADRNGMKGFSGGGISVFKGPGSGTSDSIGPISLPVGSYVIREKATKALGLYKHGGNVKRYARGGYIRRFEDGGSVGGTLQEKRFVLESKQAERRKLEKQRAETSDPAEKKRLSGEMKTLQQEINKLGGEIKDIEDSFSSLSDDIDAFSADAEYAGKTLRDSIAAEFEALTGKKPSEAKVEEILQETIRRGGKAKTDKGTITVDPGVLKELENAQKNLASRQKEKEEKFGGVSSLDELTMPVEDFVSKKREQLSAEEKKKSELEAKASTATGGEKILLNDQIKQSSAKIAELNSVIDAAKQSYGIVSEEIDQAGKEEAAASAQLESAQQALVDAIRKRAKDFDSLSDERKAAVIEEVATTGQVTDKTGKVQSFKAEADAIAAAESAVSTAKSKKEAAETKKETLYPTEGVSVMPKINTKMAQEQKAYTEYKAEKAGMSVSGYKYDLAKRVGKSAFDVRREAEFAKTETKNLAVGKARELKGVNVKDALKADTQEGRRVQGIIDQFAANLQKVDPSLGAEQARDAAIKLAEGLSEGKQSVEEIIATNKELDATFKKTLSETEIMNEAFRRTGQEIGESAEFVKANVSQKAIQQQEFISSKEGQRFGALAEFAPGMLQKFSKTAGGRALGAGADFISGKGGKLSKAFAGAGGFTGIGTGLAVGAEALKQMLPKSMTSDPNTAGALGALGGAGAGAAMGAQLGSFAGPIGTLIGGVGGAIIGGIQGFFNAKNQAILTNALEKTAAATGELEIAFKKLETDTNAVNLGKVQKAFGESIIASQDIRDMAFSSPTFTSTDAMSVGGTALAGAGTGAALGALVGSIVPVLGTAVGAAVGGAIGGIAGGAYAYFNRPSRAQREEALGATIQQGTARQEGATRAAEAQLKMTSTEDLGKMFDDLKNGVASANPVVQQYAAGIAAATGKTVEQVSAQAEELAALDAYMKLRKESGATDEQIGKELEKDRKSAIETGKRALEANGQAMLKQQMLARATKEVAIATESLLDVYRRVEAYAQRYSSELDQFGADVDAMIAGLGGDTSMKAVNRQNEQVLTNVSAYSMEEVRAAAGATAGLLGGTPEAQNLANQAVAQKVITDQIPALLRGKTGEQREQALDQVRNMLEQQGLGGAAIETVLTDLENKLAEGQGVSESELQDQIQKSFEATGKGAEALANLAKKYNDTIQKAIDLQDKYNRAILEANSYMRKATQVRLNAELDLAKALGRSPTLQELNKPFDVEVQSLTSGLVEQGALAAGQASDPMAIADAITQAEKRKKELQDAGPELVAAAAKLPPGQAGDAQREALNQQQLANIQAMGELTVASNEGRQALEKLANDGTKAANALAKIQEEQQALEGFASFAQSVFTAEPQQLAQMEIQATALDAALSGADPDFMKSRFNRQQAFAGLEQEKQFMTGQEYRDAQAKLLEESYKAQGIKGTDVVKKIGDKEFTLDQLLERVRGGIDETDPNVVAFREASEVQAKANEALGKLNLEQAFIIQEAMIGLEDFFTNEFPNILTQATTDARTDAQAKPETKPEPRKPTATETELAEAKKERDARKDEEKKAKSDAKKAEEAVGGWSPGAGRAMAATAAKGKAAEATAARKAADAKVADLEAKAKAEAETRAAQEAEEAKAKAARDAEEKARREREGAAEVDATLQRQGERAPRRTRPLQQPQGTPAEKAAARVASMPGLPGSTPQTYGGYQQPQAQAQAQVAATPAPQVDEFTRKRLEGEQRGITEDLTQKELLKAAKEKELKKKRNMLKAVRIAAAGAGTLKNKEGEVVNPRVLAAQEAVTMAEADLASINEQMSEQQRRSQEITQTLAGQPKPTTTTDASFMTSDERRAAGIAAPPSMSPEDLRAAYMSQGFIGSDVIKRIDGQDITLDQMIEKIRNQQAVANAQAAATPPTTTLSRSPQAQAFADAASLSSEEARRAAAAYSGGGQVTNIAAQAAATPQASAVAQGLSAPMFRPGMTREESMAMDARETLLGTTNRPITNITGQADPNAATTPQDPNALRQLAASPQAQAASSVVADANAGLIESFGMLVSLASGEPGLMVHDAKVLEAINYLQGPLAMLDVFARNAIEDRAGIAAEKALGASTLANPLGVFTPEQYKKEKDRLVQAEADRVRASRDARIVGPVELPPSAPIPVTAARPTAGAQPIATQAQTITVSPESLEGLTTFNTNFNSYVDKLINFQFPTIPDKIDVVLTGGNHTVDVRITGAAALEQLSKDMQKTAIAIMQPELQKLRDEISAKTGGAVKPSAALGNRSTG